MVLDFQDVYNRQAIEALKNGEIILIYDSDDRESETDMITAAEFMTTEKMTTIRKYAGGLVCMLSLIHILNFKKLNHFLMFININIVVFKCFYKIKICIYLHIIFTSNKEYLLLKI